MYPVAFGFFDTETQDNWTWFMENLRKAIRDPLLLVVSSDACKGLENAVKAMFAHVEQRECFRHLMENYVKRFVGAECMYPVARAYM
jgi:zinc finger SWIM domain-containing protein 3